MRRFLIGAVAAVAVLASAAPPAQAHHDQVCLPEVPGPVCITGLQHVVPATRAAVWARFEAAFYPLAGSVEQPPAEIQAIPESLCVDVGTPLCVTGLRGAATYGYQVAWFATFFPVWAAACTAFGPCLPPVPPA